MGQAEKKGGGKIDWEIVKNKSLGSCEVIQTKGAPNVIVVQHKGQLIRLWASDPSHAESAKLTVEGTIDNQQFLWNGPNETWSLCAAARRGFKRSNIDYARAAPLLQCTL